MAITIEQETQLYTPVFNMMPIVASSTEVNGQEFFFIDFYIKDENGDEISMSRIAPRYDNQLMKTDLMRSLEKYCTHDIVGVATPTYGVRQTSNVFKKYSLELIEMYGNVASGVASGATTTLSERYAFNGVFNDEDFEDFIYTDYVIASGSSYAKLLTDMRGADINIRTGDSFEVGWITSAGATEPAKAVNIKTYDNSGTLIGTYKIANGFSSGTDDADKFLSCLVGADDLNASTLSSGSQPVITDSVKTYTIYIENNSGTRVSEILTFRIDRNCYRASEYIRLFWVNTLGRIDSFNFNFQFDKSKQVERSSFKRLRGQFTGDTFGVDTHQHGTTNFYTKTQRKVKVRSNYLNDTEAEWLDNLADSPAIWAMIDNKLIPMVMDTNTYEIRTIEKNKLFIVEFDLSYSVEGYRQRL